ncbi:MAG: inorganic diphosphatase [Psychroflexus halocasei]
MKFNQIILVSVVVLISFSCQKKISLKEIKAKTAEDTFQMLVEIPSGTNAKIEYNKELKDFKIDQKNGKDRYINYLSYPGNYGFIPHSVQSKKEGGDGDALDVLLISKKLKTGTIVQFKPLGYLKLRDEGELDIKIIGVPIDEKLKIISAENFKDFSTDYRSARRIIQIWFENYSDDEVDILGWYDENATIELIKKSINEEETK